MDVGLSFLQRRVRVLVLAAREGFLVAQVCIPLLALRQERILLQVWLRRTMRWSTARVFFPLTVIFFEIWVLVNLAQFLPSPFLQDAIGS